MRGSWFHRLPRISLALSLALYAATAYAQTSFAPGVVDHPASSSERTKGNHLRSAAACHASKGQWYAEKGSQAFCTIPYPDAGKACKSSRDCAGHCIAPVTDGTVLQGTCQKDDSTDDCGRPHFENGKVIYFNCD